jgi:transposase
MARPSKLEPDLQDRIVSLLRAGNYVETAVQACGITPRTHYDWMAKGELVGDVDPAELKGAELKAAAARLELPAKMPAAEKRAWMGRYYGYREAVLNALAEAESIAVAHIAKAARDDWRAASWFLERAFPERFAKTSPKVRAAPLAEEPGGSRRRRSHDEPEVADGDQAGL